MMFEGAAIYYKTRLQPVVALSSTEAEFVNMADAGKAALYIRWILKELGVIQLKPTPIKADNAAAIKMANTGKPTRRTRHLDIKHFIILQWCDDELISFHETRSNSCYSDSLLKPTKRTKFNEHLDIFMGRRKPAYTLILPPKKTNDPPKHTKIINYISSSTWNQKYLLNNPLYTLTQRTYDTFDYLSAGRC